MSILIGGGVAAIAVIGYVGRKGWLAFHRAVGIKPGTMIYKDPEQLPPPPMIQLQLSETLLKQLPPMIIEQLARIDNKADMYQLWKADLEQSGQTPATSEDEFIVSKLLTARLPEMIENYRRIAVHEHRLQQTDPHSLNTHKMTTLEDATVLLVTLLNQTENKLDTLLEVYRDNSMQDMQVMNRYLEDR